MDTKEYNYKFYENFYSQKESLKRIIWSGLHYRNKYFQHFVKALTTSSEKYTIVDYGFGSGELLSFFSPDHSINGVEFVDCAIKTSKIRLKKHKHVDLRKIEQTETPYVENFSNVTICSHVLEHAPSDEILLKELIRITKLSGFLVIAIPINEYSGQDPRHIRIYEAENFLSILKKHKLKVLKYDIYDNYYFYNLTNIWTHLKRHGKVTLFDKTFSIFINTLFTLLIFSIPFSTLKKIDSKIINQFPAKKPHQLIVLCQKI